MKFMNKPSTSKAVSTSSSTETSHENQPDKPSTSKTTNDSEKDELLVKEENETTGGIFKVWSFCMTFLSTIS